MQLARTKKKIAAIAWSTVAIFKFCESFFDFPFSLFFRSLFSVNQQKDELASRARRQHFNRWTTDKNKHGV
jgi:hypothetical protein